MLPLATNSLQLYYDRLEAGQVLAHRLQHWAARASMVLALRDSSVPIGRQIAETLGALLDVFLVRPLELPARPGVPVGAVVSGGVQVLDQLVIDQEQVSEGDIAAMTDREVGELQRQEEAFRAGRPAVDVKNQTVILVDDGMATGFSMRAAIIAIRQFHPKQLVVAVPVASPETCFNLAAEVDEVICPLQPRDVPVIGLWYRHFDPLDSSEVRQCLAGEGI